MEVRSYEVEHLAALWHLDFHHASRKVITRAGTWVKPMLLGVINHPQSSLADLYRELGDIFAVPLRPHKRWGGFKVLRERWLTHLETTRRRALAGLNHLLAGAGNASLMTPTLRHTLCDHAAATTASSPRWPPNCWPSPRSVNCPSSTKSSTSKSSPSPRPPSRVERLLAGDRHAGQPRRSRHRRDTDAPAQ